MQIKNLLDYLSWVDVHKFIYYDEQVKEPICDLFYRGQSNIGWDIVPSLFSGIVKVDDECKIIQNAFSRLWNELQPYHTELDKLTVLRHYGLPSRMLDVTSNPLIALYLTCKEYNGKEEDGGKDGVVYYGSCETIPLRAEAIAHIMANYDFSEKGYLGIDKSIYSQADLERVALDLKLDIPVDELIYALTHPILLHAPMNSTRINAQSGAFVIAPIMKEEFGEDNTPYYKRNQKYVFEHKMLDQYKNKEHRIEEAAKHQDWCFFKECAIIKKENKKRLLKELDVIGINDATVYLELENKINAIKNRFSMDTPSK